MHSRGVFQRMAEMVAERKVPVLAEARSDLHWRVSPDVWTDIHEVVQRQGSLLGIHVEDQRANVLGYAVTEDPELPPNSIVLEQLP